MSLGEVVAKKGEIVTCPKCKAEIAQLTRDLARGDRLEASQFDGIQRTILNGQKMECFFCRELWVNSRGKMHLQRGWTL